MEPYPNLPKLTQTYLDKPNKDKIWAKAQLVAYFQACPKWTGLLIQARISLLLLA
jgi:hypothetical protein